MSDYIVLVKQVPDVSQITDNAFDPETGTLVRSRLASVINELDAQALAFARHMKTISGDAKARLVALTMGPPMADEVLRYSLARAADQVGPADRPGARRRRYRGDGQPAGLCHPPDHPGAAPVRR